jgi:large subunit ribosomal protein L10
LKVGVVDGKVIDVNGIKQLAELPSKEVLIAKVLGGFNAPITGFVNVLNGNLRGLAIVLNAIAEKKQSA